MTNNKPSKKKIGKNFELPKVTPYLFNYYPKDKLGYLKLSNNKIHSTLPLIEGKLLLDRDKNGEVVGVEVIDL